MIEFIVGGFFGVLFGFFTCAILNAGKVADLEKELRSLREDMHMLEKYPITYEEWK